MKFKGKHLYEINPTFYEIILQKEICKRYVKNLFSKDKIAKTKQEERLPNIVSSRNSNLIKRAKGIDIRTQEGKATNIKIAGSKINGIIIHPGEVFSFWQTVGKAKKKKGYQEGRLIVGKELTTGIGGGLCNLGNTIHWMVLHSPLEVVEFHKHSDALAPDHGKREPFSSGTSVCYNMVDYKFKNNTDQDVQLIIWCENEKLYGELRSEKEFPYTYELVEEDHHFQKEGDKYYRVSKIYKQITDRKTGKIIGKELVLDNHSEVMFDYSLIPQEQIRDEKVLV